MKIKLHCTAGFAGMHNVETVEVPDGTPGADLDRMAEEYMNDVLQPESWWTNIENDEDED